MSVRTRDPLDGYSCQSEKGAVYEYLSTNLHVSENLDNNKTPHTNTDKLTKLFEGTEIS